MTTLDGSVGVFTEPADVTTNAESGWSLLLPAGMHVAPESIAAVVARAASSGAELALIRPRGARGGDRLFRLDAPGNPRELPVLDIPRVGALVRSELSAPLGSLPRTASYRSRIAAVTFAATTVIGIECDATDDGPSPDIHDISAQVEALAEIVVSAGLTDAQRTRHLRAVLRRDVHDRLLVAAARASDDVKPDQLEDIADVVRRRFDESAERGLPPRALVFVRLLRAGHHAAAWQVAKDNAIGVVPEDWRWSTSSGAARAQSALPLLTTCDDGRAYAWLPGFRDPRFGAPDDCYDISAKVRLRCHIDEVLVTGSMLTLSGWCFLSELPATASERVTVIASRIDGDVTMPFAARRVRRPDHVSGTGSELTRRAYAGWAVDIPLRQLRRAGGTAGWQLSLEVDQSGVRRSADLGPDRAQLADTQLHAAATQSFRWSTTVALDSKDRVVVRLTHWPRLRRLVPTRLRRVLRRG